MGVVPTAPALVLSADLSRSPALFVVDPVTLQDDQPLGMSSARRSPCVTVGGRDLPLGAAATAPWCVLYVSWRDRSPLEEGFYQHFCNFIAVEVAGIELAPDTSHRGWRWNDISAGNEYFHTVRG
jgi:hypothetical protein